MNKPIYEPRGRAREYGELAVNIYTGCNHGCSYCYAPAVLHRGREKFAEVQPRPGIVEAVRRQLEREKKTGRTIFLCFTCDPYPAEIDTTPRRRRKSSKQAAGPRLGKKPNTFAGSMGAPITSKRTCAPKWRKRGEHNGPERTS